MKDASLFSSLFDRFDAYRNTQELRFKEIGEKYPVAETSYFRGLGLSTKEVSELKKIESDNCSQGELYRRIVELLNTRAVPKMNNRLVFTEACAKFNFELADEIPRSATEDFDSFYLSLPSKIRMSKPELAWLYKHGFFPHIRWERGKPLFNKREWFILDFIISDVKERVGLGVFNSIHDYLVSSSEIKLYLSLTTYMHNSWELGVKIMRYCDKTSRKMGYKGEEYRLHSSLLRRHYWKNEGRVIASEIIEHSKLNKPFKIINFVEYYRDVFALRSFAAFPVHHLVDLFHKPSARAGVMFQFEFPSKVKTYNMGHGDINTYDDESYAMSYSHLYSSMEWALSMFQGRDIESELSIVKKYSDNPQLAENKRICPYCHQEYIPVRPKYSVTCGKKECVKANRNESKRRNRLITPVIME